MKHTITFMPDKVPISVDEATNLLHAVKAAGVHMHSSCGGKGNCGKCKVIVREGAVDSGNSGAFLTAEEMERGYVLACLATARSDLRVDIPPESRMQAKHRIETGANPDEIEHLKQTVGCFIEPHIRRFYLEINSPTIDDNISDYERLRRALDRAGIDAANLHLDHHTLTRLPHVLRAGDWNVTVSVLATGTVLQVLDVYPGDVVLVRYGAAVDIGTTTITVYLVDMTTGRILGTAATYNSQVTCGDDVITRIVYAAERNGLPELQSLVVENIDSMLQDLAEKNDVRPEMIDSIVVAGNTTMEHLFYGVDPQYIREEPYIPAAAIFPIIRGKNVGLRSAPLAAIYLMPNVASYVGGDITAGVLASQIHKQNEVSLFIDIGTNGEIVLGNKDWLVTAACSAGPCFEGSGIMFGMRAMEGAIDEVKIHPKTFETSIGVIGEVKPIGICGSGMIDALAEMYLSGVIDQKGRIREEIGSQRIRRGENGLEYVLVWRTETAIDKDIVLTEADLDNLLRAKAAIYAGFATLLGQMGIPFTDVNRIFIAGGFGRYIDVERAITIGMLPDLPIDRFTFLGNTSIMGAYYVLLCDSLRTEVETTARKMTYVELSASRSFMDEYMSALFLPHTNLNAFPRVRRELEIRKTI